jgi:hypothetical protein
VTNILPEPTDTMPVISPPDDNQPTYRINRQTLWAVIVLILIGFACLIAAFIYDYSHNHAQDNTRKADLAYVSNFLSGYYELNHYYPTLSQLNSNTFGAFAPSLDKAKFKDPSANNEVLTASPTTSSYAYEVLPSSCNNKTAPCTGYKLVAILSDGKDYVLANPKPKV